MNKSTWIFISLFLFLFSSLGLSAQSAAEIQQAMKERLPKIDAMKLQGVIGENNQGYVEARDTVSPEQRKLIAEENADRKKLYNIVARRTGVELQEVEMNRAAQLRHRSPSGIWLQDEEGNWFQK